VGKAAGITALAQEAARRTRRRPEHLTR
jgi:hypothetical protein